MPKFTQRMADMEKSANIINNLFHAMTDPETISFGGGAPAKETLPFDEVHEITNDVITLDKRGIDALQYSNPGGLSDLREVVAGKLLAPKGVNASPDHIIITASGLEGINFMCQAFIAPGDVILVESPTFVHAVEILEMFQAKCVAVEMDDDGMIIEDAEEKIK